MVSNKKLKGSFGAISKNYDRYRPDYPKKLITDIILYTKIKKSSNILEIGSGSGQASQYFLRKDFNLIMLDISRELITIAKKKFKNYKNAKYIINSFEKAKLPSDNYDLIFSAQAFHWINPNLGFKKAHKLLKENGALAVFWNLVNKDESKMLQQIEKLYKKYCPDFKPDKTDKTIKIFRNNPAFKKVILRQYPRTILFTKFHYLKLIQTFSWIASLTAKQKLKLLKEINKELSKYKEPLHIPCKTLLCMGKKK
ncbi:MAG: methyltransferase domain-containing protein [Patescibacteria group bacterium]|jgi:ubiquinone/menaquinone biosynthesis C-methylase UbiE